MRRLILVCSILLSLQCVHTSRTLETRSLVYLKEPDPRLEREAVVTCPPEICPPKLLRVMVVITTGYTSREKETDDSPWITCTQDSVLSGGCASNELAMGTVIVMPEKLGGKALIVNDRMNERYLASEASDTVHIDVWFKGEKTALAYGRDTTSIWILNPDHPDNKQTIAYLQGKVDMHKLQRYTELMGERRRVKIKKS